MKELIELSIKNIKHEISKLEESLKENKIKSDEFFIFFKDAKVP
jgi:hypothetical protein